MRESCKWSLSLRLPSSRTCIYLLLPLDTTCPVHPVFLMSCSFCLPWFNHPNRPWREVTSWNTSLCSFFQSPFTSSLLAALCLSPSNSWTPSAYILLIMLEIKFHSHTKIKQNCNSLCFNLYVLRYQKVIGRNMLHACMQTKCARRILVGRPSADELGVNWKKMWEGSCRNNLSR